MIRPLLRWLLLFIAAPLAADSGPDGDFAPGGLRLLPYPGAFMTTPPDQALALLRDPQGRLLSVLVTRDSEYTQLQPERDRNLVLHRILADGRLDASFGLTPFGAPQGFHALRMTWSEFNGAVLDAQGRYLLVGVLADQQVGVRGYTVTRLLATGPRDNGFGTSGVVAFDFGGGPGLRGVAIAAMANDDALMAGNRDGGDILLRRLSALDGTGVDSFGIGFGFALLRFRPVADAAIDTVVALQPLPDQRVLVIGQSCTAAIGCRPALARLNANGSLDTSFCSSAACLAATAAGTGHGRMVLQEIGVSGHALSELRVLSAARDASGRILLAAASEPSVSAAPMLVLRLLADGTPDSSFGPASSPGRRALALPGNVLEPYALTLDAAQRIIIGGDARASDGTRPFLARLNSTGTPDTSFAQGSALRRYFGGPGQPQRSLRALHTSPGRIQALGDFEHGSSRLGYLLQVGGEAVFRNGFQ